MDSAFENLQMNYSIVLYINGTAGQFTYDISSKEYERLKNQYGELSNEIVGGSKPRFFPFTTKSKVDIVVSIKDIQAAYFLFDTGISDKEVRENRPSIRIYLRNREEAISVEVDDPSVILDLFTSLELDVSIKNPFFSIENIDKEEIFVNAREVVLVEFESEILQKGLQSIRYKEEIPKDVPAVAEEGFPDEILN